MSAIQLVEATDTGAWDRFLARSPQGTRFCDRTFLASFDEPIRYWFLTRKDVPILALMQAERTEQRGELLPYCYYQGPMFSDELWKSAPPKRTQYEIELAETCMLALSQQVKHVALSLHPSLQDVRGYDWLHYHQPERGRAHIAPRYTAIVDLTDATPASLRAAARSARRQEERYALERDGLTFAEDGSIQDVVDLAQASFARQGTQLPPADEQAMRAIAKRVLATKTGHLCTVRAADGSPRANALVLHDFDGTEHVMLVGTSDDRYAGTLLYFGMLDGALARGAPRIDFNGANSPQRGYFKHSIGAPPQLYFEVTWCRPTGNGG